MRRRYRWVVGGAALAVFLLGGLGLFVATRGIDAYRAAAEHRLGLELGVPVVIGGGLSLALGWSPVVILRDVALGPSDPTGTPMARVDRVEVRLALWPFATSLGRVLVAERIALRGAHAWLGHAEHAADPDRVRSNPTNQAADISVRLLAIEISDSVLHVASGPEVVDLEIARASAVPRGEALGVTASGSVAGRALRLDGTIDGFERWLHWRQAPLGIDVRGELGEVATLRLHGNLRDGGADLSLLVAFRDVHDATTDGQPPPPKLSARLRADDQEAPLSLSEIMLEVGGLTITGDGELRRGTIPHLRLALRASQPAGPDGDGVPIALPGGAALESDAVLSNILARLKRLTAEIDLSADAVTLPGGVRLTDWRSRVEIRDGKAMLRELAAALAGGAIAVTGEAHASGEFTGRLHARDMDLGRLLREAHAGSALSGGRFVLKADLKGRFGEASGAVRSLQGSVDLSVGRASFVNAYADRFGVFQVFNLIDRALPTGGTIAINCAVGRFAIADGVATTRGLMIDLPRLALWVSGRIDLAAQTIAMRVEPQPKVAALISVVPPVNIRGTLSRPVVEPDVVGAAVGVVSGFLSTPGLLAAEVGDVLSGIGDLVTGSSSRARRQSDGCRVPRRPARDERPGLRIPNPLDWLR